MAHLRNWLIQNAVEDRLRGMSEAELLGADTVLGIIHQSLDKAYFQEQSVVDIRALTKTMEELHEISGEILYHTYGRKDMMNSSGNSTQ